MPNRNVLLGATGRPTLFRPVFVYGMFGGWPTQAAITGARMASSASSRMTIKEATATLSWRSRRQASTHGLRPSITWVEPVPVAPPWNSISVRLMPHLLKGCCLRRWSRRQRRRRQRW